MLIIRLRRAGKKRKPTYRIVVAEHTMPIDGKFVEDLGFYNPHTKLIKIEKDEVLSWLKKGAKPSNTVAKLLQKEKMKHNSIVVSERHKKPKVKEDGAPKPTAAPEVEATTDEPTLENTESAVESPMEEQTEPVQAPESSAEAAEETKPQA